MAGDTKLLGTLQLDAEGVKRTINEVNNALKTMGQGVDLDLTKIVNAKVNSQLNELKKQIDAINKAATGMGASQRDQVNQAVSLMKQQIDLENKMMKQGVSGAYAEKMHDLQKQYTDLTKNFTKEMNDAVQSDSRVKNAWTEWENTAERVSKKYSSISEQTTKQAMDAAQKETKYKLEQADKVAKADEKIAAQKQKQFDKEYAQLEKAEKEKLALEQSTVEKQRELEANSYAAWWKEALDKRDMEKKLGDESVQSQIQSATKLLKEQADIEKRLASGTAGPNETNVLNQRLAANKEALKQYSDEIMNTAKADASVVEAQQGVAMAQAQAQDRILKENQKAQEEATKAAEANAKRMKDYQKQWANYAVSALGAASLAVLKKQWTEAVDYATKYYDALNEIRIVSNDMSQQDVDQFGQKMRDIAEEMKVTSTELSQAAITFFRQGLEPAEVEDRLRWVTEYAKVAHMEFDEAAQLMTAAINTMGDSIQESGFENVVEHIADVWLYLGDNAATSGEEIGKAMQKASASAQEFGMSFEWLGTYIAVVSEQTRQAPEAIGNAFNTMMARMHQIKQNGFNDEDTTKLNDVAKALATINVELMDSDGEWRDMSDIYSDIADKWGEMDAKQRGYIATTMAGTRQQNVFYALMNDLSKGIEGGSRAWELYTGAMTSAGTATQKYAVYQQSVEASQADMTNSLEQLYSNLQPTIIKGFYEMIAFLVDGLNNLGGTFPIVIAGLVGLGAAFKAATAFANPLVAVLTGAAAIMGTLAAEGVFGTIFNGQRETSAQKYESAAQNYKELGNSIQQIQSLQDTLSNVWEKQANGIQISASEMEAYNAALKTVASLSPEARGAVEALTSGLGNQAEAAQKVADVLHTITEEYKARQQIEAREALNNYASPFNISGGETYTSGASILSQLAERGFDTTSSEALANVFKKAWEMRGPFANGVFGETLANDMASYFVAAYEMALDKSITQFSAQDFSDNMNPIAAALNKMLIGNTQDTGLQKELGDEMEKVLTWAMNSVDIPSSETGIFADKIRNIIVGEDGILTKEDFEEDIISQVRQFVTAYANGFQEFSNEDILSTAISDFFGKNLVSSFEKEISRYAESSELTNVISETIYGLIAAGVTKQDFGEVIPYLSDFIENGVLGMLQQILDSRLGISGVNEYMGAGNWNLDEEATTIMLSLTKVGKSLEDFQKVAAKSESLAEFKKNLQKLFSSDDGGGGGEGGTKTLMSDAEALISEIKKFQGIIEDIDNGKPLDISDILNIGEAHPEILALVGDVEALKTALEGLADSANGSLREKLRSLILSQNDNLAGTPYASASTKGYTSLAQVQNYLEAGGDAYKANLASFNAWLDEQVDALLAMVNAGNSANESISALESTMEKMSAIDNLEKAAETLRDLRDVGASDVLGAIQTIQKNMETLGLSVGDLPEEPAQRAEWLANALGQIDDLVKSQHDTLLETLGITEEQYQALLQQAEAEEQAKQAAEDAKKAEEERLQAYKDYLKEQKSSGEQDRASSRNYSDQITYLRRMYNSRGSEGALTGWESIGNLNKELQTTVQNTFPRLATVLAKIATNEGDAAANAEELDKALSEAEETVKKLTEVDQAKYFKETAGELKELIANGGDYTDALEAFTKEEEIAIAAQQEFIKIVEDGGVTAETTTDDVANLSKALGWDANSILKNWERIGPLMEQLGVDMEALRASLQKEIFLSLVGTSTADFSAIQEGLMSVENMAQSTIDALVATGQFEVVRKWMEEGMEYQTFDPTGNIITTTAQTSGFVDVIVPSGGTVPTKSQGGGGGGGGGGNKTKTTRGSARVLQTMSNIQDLQKNTQSLYQAQAGYYEQTGQLQGVILYRQKEIEALEKMNETLETNLTELERWIDEKKEELGTLDESSEEYKEVYGELEALMERHQEYTLAVIENKTQVISLTDSIRDLKYEIRDMQIDVYNEVVNALKARDEAQQKLEERQKRELDATVKVQKAILDVIGEQKQKSDKMRQGALNIEKLILNTIKQQDAAIKKMLQGRISMERIVLSIIQAQAAAAASIQQGRLSMENTLGSVIRANIERERDAAVKAAQEADQAASAANERQIDALQKQRDLLDEQLKLRKEMAKAQDRQAELAELEAQYARISADPTRMKEALKIREQIDKLRDEIAWDIAEKEVEAQQKAIDEQIDALSGQEFNSAAAVSDYYDKLLNDTEAINAQIEEMLDTMSDAEIIEWLKENSEEYKGSTRTGKEAMVEDWQDQLNQMRGVTESFVDEINAVLSGSREEILEWLKANDLEYAKASDAQKQQMVQDWEDALNEMYGITETHWDQVKEVMESGLEGFLDFMERNNTEYAEMSDTEKEITKQGWIDTWNEMTGEVEDHREEVASIMQEGYDAFLEYMMQNSEAFKTATAEEKLSMVNSWKEMWNDMNTTTKNYEDEANAIIAKGQQAIIATLTEYTENYAEVGRLQSEKYVDEWTSKLAELEAALASVSTMVDNVGSKYETLVATGAVDKANEIDSAKADTTIDKLLDQAGLEHFAAGGLATTTGPVWVDGSPQLPERILSPYQTELFSVLVRSMEEMSRVSIPTLPNFGGDFMTGGNNNSLSFGDIIVNVEHLDSDTDYEDMAGHVLDSVMEKINRSSVVGGIRYSR